MTNFIIYSAEIAISLALFYTAYWAFLKKETFFKLNRFYLMSSVVVSLLTPLLNITIGKDSFITRHLVLPIERCEQSIIENSGAKKGSMENEMLISANDEGRGMAGVHERNGFNSGLGQGAALNSPEKNDPEKTISWLTVLLAIYFTGVVLFLVRFAANFIRMFGYALKHKPQRIDDMKVIRLEKNSSPFSFLNFIFISHQDYPEAELAKIISHEKVHIRQKHSADLIVLELLLAFQWFNPFIWLYKRAIKITHEYLADQGTLNAGIDLPGYQYSLLSQVLRDNNLEIASTYNLSVKKRIDMMMKKRSPKLSALKLTVALPILIFLFSAFAFSARPSEKETTHEKNKLTALTDTSIKKVNVPDEYLKLLEGNYISTNEPGRVRRITFVDVLGTLIGSDNGYRYEIIPVGGGKFINPDDKATLVFDTKDKNAISLLLFGTINLKKVKESAGFPKRSIGFLLANRMAGEGVTAGLSYYKAVKDSANYDLNEGEMNVAGSMLLEAGKTKEAAAMFKINAEKFPQSFNTYDSYAEALLALGDKAQAIENFKKSVKLNPGSVNGLKRLKELGVNTDDLVKKVTVPAEYLKLLEGVYLSTNDPNGMRKIIFAVEEGVLTGTDAGYKYKLVPMGDGKFINPDDGASLVFDTKDKDAVSLLLFGRIDLKKAKLTKEPALSLKDYAGIYVPFGKDTIIKKMEIVYSNNKLSRFVETDPNPAGKTIELEFVTDNLFFYADRSSRSIEFVVDDKKQVTACIIRRPNGTFKLMKQK